MDRLGCLVLPELRVAEAQAREPSLRGRAFVLLEHGRVVAASPAARHGGVRTGMTPAQARVVCRGVLVREDVPARVRAREQDLVAALRPRVGEVEVGALEDREVAGGPGAGVLLFDAGEAARRAGSPGETPIDGERRALERLVLLVGSLGLEASAASAATRFTALVAARAGGASGGEPSPLEGPEIPVTVVPSGAEAAFLATRPIGVAPMSEDEYFVLRSLGLRRLGDVATIDPGVLEARLGPRGPELARLALGRDAAGSSPGEVIVASDRDRRGARERRRDSPARLAARLRRIVGAGRVTTYAPSVAPPTRPRPALVLRSVRPARPVEVGIEQGRPVALRRATMPEPIVSARRDEGKTEAWDVALAEGSVLRIEAGAEGWWIVGQFD